MKFAAVALAGCLVAASIAGCRGADDRRTATQPDRNERRQNAAPAKQSDEAGEQLPATIPDGGIDI